MTKQSKAKKLNKKDTVILQHRNMRDLYRTETAPLYQMA